MKNPGVLRVLHRLLLPAALAAQLAGCASLAPNVNPRDPFESYNRPMSEFNEKFDSVLLKPVATAYRQAVPAVVRTSVSNFFHNVSDAWSGVNSLLQFQLGNAGENFLRFGINSTFGVAGIFDLASEMNIERHREDFGQTLGRWGVPAGPYVVLPLLGPSTVRDALVLPIDAKGDLVREVRPVASRNALYGTRIVNTRANLLRIGNVIEEAALDRYTFTRDAFLQKRRAEIEERQQREVPLLDGKGADAPAAPAAAPPASAPAPAAR